MNAEPIEIEYDPDPYTMCVLALQRMNVIVDLVTKENQNGQYMTGTTMKLFIESSKDLRKRLEIVEQLYQEAVDKIDAS